MSELKPAISIGCLLLLSALVVDAADPPLLAKLMPGSTSAGTLKVAPSTGVSGEFGTWTVTYTVGSDGIRPGGGIRVQLPDSWHSGPQNSANRLQSTDPADDHYVSARASRGGVELQTVVEAEGRRPLVKHAKVSLDGRFERYVFVVRVHVVKGALKPGDTVDVVYGDREQGSRGYRAAAISTEPEPILLALDAEGRSRFVLHSSRSATLRSLPGDAVEMMVHVPSSGAVGEDLVGKVALIDKQSNAVHQTTSVRLEVVEGEAIVPASVTTLPAKGYTQFRVSARAAGIVRLRAVSESGLRSQSNPFHVTEHPPIERTYWGDLHSHGRFSWDGVGSDNFNYARYISGLDFYSMTDHALEPVDGRPKGLSATTWKEYQALTDAFHDPPRFVTLHAYECSFKTPWGHHNVYFRDRPGSLFTPTETTLPALWETLTAGEALTIPHHTGKFPKDITFTPQNELLRRNFEIYSAHGLSELYDPEHPLAFERSLFTARSKSLRQPSYFQDVLAAGLRFSAIASSDDHRGQPGKPHYGLVAVRAPRLSREAIFDGLFARRTYATTGAKILLDFEASGIPMGGSGIRKSPLQIRVAAVGTDQIDEVTIVAYPNGVGKFHRVMSWNPGSSRFEGHVEAEFTGEKLYYVRVKQTQRIRGIDVMAWSSPIWVRSPR